MIAYLMEKENKNLFYRIINKIDILEYECGKLFLVQTVNNNNKLIKKLKENNIKYLVVSKKLKSRTEFINKIYTEGIKILDGSFLLKNMISNIIEYLSEISGIKKEKMEITFLINDFSNIKYIENSITKVRNINIITNNIRKFKKISDKIYKDMGNIITVANNRNKSLLNKKIIINLDFPEEQINRYKINRKAIIINIENNINITQKTFNGVNTKGYIIKEKDEFENFNFNEIYEARIIEKKDINKKIKEEDIKIKYFIGKNGIINKTEFIKILEPLVKQKK